MIGTKKIDPATIAAIVSIFIVVALGIYFLVKKFRKTGAEGPKVVTNPPQAPVVRPEGPPSLGSIMDRTFCNGGPCIS